MLIFCTSCIPSEVCTYIYQGHFQGRVSGKVDFKNFLCAYVYSKRNFAVYLLLLCNVPFRGGSRRESKGSPYQGYKRLDVFV